MSISLEVGSCSPDFIDRLGDIFGRWADKHPTPDDPVMEFVGEGSDGTIGKSRMTPREYAQAIIDGTPVGIVWRENYRQISTNLGDPTGQRVLDDLEEAFFGEKEPEEI